MLWPEGGNNIISFRKRTQVNVKVVLPDCLCKTQAEADSEVRDVQKSSMWFHQVLNYDLFMGKS